MDAATKVNADQPKLNRVQNRQLLTRIKLMTAAYTLISARGIDDTTIQEITEAADVGFGTFYNYFGSKDEIIVKVLDCVMYTLGRRNDLATKAARLSDPVVIISNSARLVMREMMTNPLWRSWTKRPDILAERMRICFGPFGLRDIRGAVEADECQISGHDIDAAWSSVNWILAGIIKDIVDGRRPPEAESLAAEAVLRVLGVEFGLARKVSSRRLPAYPPLAIDFSFDVTRDG